MYVNFAKVPLPFKASIASMKLFKWKIKNKLTAISFSFSFLLWNYGSYTHQQKFLGHHYYYHYIAEQCWVEKGLEGQVIRFFAEFCLCKILFAKTLWENCWRHKGLLSLYGTGSSKMFKRRERWFLSKMKIAFLSYIHNVYIFIQLYTTTLFVGISIIENDHFLTYIRADQES